MSQLAKETAELAVKFATGGTRVAGANLEGPEGDLAQFVADHIDVTWDLVKEVGKGGAASKAHITTLLMLKIGAAGNVLPNQKAKCGVALASLSAGLILAGAEIAGGISAPLGFATAISVLSDFYATANDCKEPAKELVQEAKSAAQDAGRTFNALNTPQGMTWLMRRMGGY